MSNDALDTLPAPFHKIRHEGKRALLAAYMKCGFVGEAAESAGYDRTIHYHWKKSDPDYAAAFEVAHDVVIGLYEDEASRRALGWDETRYTNDGEPYTLRKY